MRSHNKFYPEISIGKGHFSEEIFRFSDIVGIPGEIESVTEKITSGQTEMSKSKNDNETQNGLGENPLSIHRTSSNETTLIFEIPNIIN